MELLAPAGGIDQLRAAVRFGADAVYLACDKFGMRARASNFSMQSLSGAVQEAHAAGVKVHVACNILMHEAQMRELPEFFEAVQNAGADALIIGDLGAFMLAKKHAPRVELHVSTQASVANAQAACVWHDMGASRVVCAREMTLSEIAHMREHTPPTLAIEVFAHGAMCMAISGRCLISSALTGRSANAGNCTQPCRWAYTLEEEKRPGVYIPVEEDAGYTYIMNAMDLNMLAHLDKLRAAGVDSIKIEGRNKKAFYVASVVSAYRRVLDGEEPSSVESELFDISHRPYNTGFFFGPAQQAICYDGYEQECVHVGDVVGCERVRARGEGFGVPTAVGGEAAGAKEPVAACAGTQTRDAFKITAVCRNRWSEGDILEALVPGAPAIEFEVQDLCWVPDGKQETGSAHAGATESVRGGAAPCESSRERAEVPTDTANRAMDTYTFTCPCEISAGSYLRARTHRRTARHL